MGSQPASQLVLDDQIVETVTMRDKCDRVGRCWLLGISRGVATGRPVGFRHQIVETVTMRDKCERVGRCWLLGSSRGVVESVTN